MIEKIDKYFLEEKCPFSQKRKIKTKNIQYAFGVVIVCTIGFILFAGEAPSHDQKAVTASIEASTQMPSSSTTARPDGGISLGNGWNSTGSLSAGYSGSRSFTGGSARQYGASQLVKASEAGGNGFGLPMGTTVNARLMNALLSSDSNQPVIAELTEDAIWRNSLLIPTGTKAIGSASFDDASKRLQIRFHTFVYPEGDQHGVSAVALLGDGSSGIPGNYHSGAGKKEVGRFIGNFIGGFADGMKERQAGGQAGIAFEPGSLRNGILNGVTNSAVDQAKVFSEGMQNVKPFLEVAGGTSFLLYFEKEYSP